MQKTQQRHSLVPFEMRSVMLCAAFAFAGTLAQAQTGNAPAVAAGQSTAPHTTNTQSAVSADKKATGSAVIGPASSSTGTMNGSAGQGTDVNNRSNLPHATPGASDPNDPATSKSGKKSSRRSNGTAAGTSEDVRGQSNLPHSTPGAPKTDPSSNNKR